MVLLIFKLKQLEGHSVTKHTRYVTVLTYTLLQSLINKQGSAKGKAIYPQFQEAVQYTPPSMQASATASDTNLQPLHSTAEDPVRVIAVLANAMQLIRVYPVFCQILLCQEWRDMVQYSVLWASSCGVEVHIYSNTHRSPSWI